MSRALRSGTLYIVCEGEKTEKSFFSDLHANLKGLGQSPFEQVDFYLVPKPKELADDLDNKELRHDGGRAIHIDASKPVTPTENYEPLNWIKIAFEKLGAYPETWAVFDNDHRNQFQGGVPFIDNALAEYRRLTMGGANVHVAYSSLSFEYYLLQHFEMLYRPFEKTECYVQRRGIHKYQNCCSQDPKSPPLEAACDGLLEHDCCINGYARRKNYWEASKVEGMLSKVPNVYVGVIHSARIRWQAIQNQRSFTLGNMNPYLNTYQLALRMMGVQMLEYDRDIRVRYGNDHIVLHLRQDKIVLFNQSDKMFVLSEGYTTVYEPNSSELFGKDEIGNLGRCVVTPGTSWNLDISMLVDDRFSMIEIENERILVSVLPKPTPELTAVECEQCMLN